MARVLVTGGLGLVGRWVVRELIRREHVVTVFELDDPRTRAAARAFVPIHVIFGDLRDPIRVAQAVRDQDYVIHLGCLLPPGANQHPELARAVNVDGTQNVIDACRAQPTPPRLLHGSSGEVYGKTRHLAPPRRIDDPLVAANPYAESKIEAEARVRASGIDHVVLRLSAVIDISLASSHPLMFEFPVDVRMEVIHAADVAVAVANCLDVDGVWGRGAILPIAGGERCRTTYGAFVNGMLEAMGVGALPAEAFTPDDYPSDWHDTRESQALLCYQRHSLDDIRDHTRALLGWRRWFVPLARPFVRWSILRRSPHL